MAGEERDMGRSGSYLGWCLAGGSEENHKKTYIFQCLDGRPNRSYFGYRVNTLTLVVVGTVFTN
jgi:hypothetical protein